MLMKPSLETIDLSEDQVSFKYFRLEMESLDPHWHYHPEIEISYIERGRGLRFVGDHIGTFEPGDLTLNGVNLPHDRVTEKEEPDLTKVAYVLQFGADLLKDFPECAHLHNLFDEARQGILFHNASTHLIELIKGMEYQNHFQRLLSLLQVLNALYEHEDREILSTISYHQSSVSDHQHRVERVTTHVVNNFDKSIGLSDVAGMIGMTVPSFCRWFKQSVGKSFVTYVNTVRIERACQFLWQTDWPIAQVAFSTGFESLSNFNRFFKRVKGESPRVYRARKDVLTQDSSTRNSRMSTPSA